MASEAKNVLLAEKWDEGKIDPTGYWMSEKLDGVRAYWSGKTFFSRQGNPFNAPKWFTQDLPPTPLDGELWCGRGLFQKCLSIIKKQKDSKEEDWKFVTYLVFDAPSNGGMYEERLAYLNKTVKAERSTTYAAVVGVQLCKGADHLKATLAEVEKLGGEGLMLREPKSHYVHARSTTLLKVKTFHDEEAKVVGHKPGDGRLTGMMGGLECVLPNGVKFTVGTGFSDAQRRHPPKIGSVITFKFQETTTSGTPRFPVYVRERGDVTWADVLENAKTKTPHSQKEKKTPILKKQHSILYSTVPSRDQITGAKVVTDDDDAESPPPADAKDTSGAAPVCKFGEACYRTSDAHLKAFSHPWHTKKEAEKRLDKTAAASSGKTACMFGADCYLSNPIHLSKYSHPDPSTVQPSAAPVREDDDDDDVPPAVPAVADDDKAMPPPAAPAPPADDDDPREICVYDAACMRKNPAHFKEFRHPQRDLLGAEGTDETPQKAASSADELPRAASEQRSPALAETPKSAEPTKVTQASRKLVLLLETTETNYKLDVAPPSLSHLEDHVRTKLGHTSAILLEYFDKTFESYCRLETLDVFEDGKGRIRVKIVDKRKASDESVSPVKRIRPAPQD